jgi:hypothetical protein
MMERNWRKDGQIPRSLRGDITSTEYVMRHRFESAKLAKFEAGQIAARTISKVYLCLSAAPQSTFGT